MAAYRHFQTILDFNGMSGDYPGVCRRSERDQWAVGMSRLGISSWSSFGPKEQREARVCGQLTPTD